MLVAADREGRLPCARTAFTDMETSEQGLEGEGAGHESNVGGHSSRGVTCSDLCFMGLFWLPHGEWALGN